MRRDRSMPSRRFPAPWRAEKMPGGYVVRDANGQALAYICNSHKPIFNAGRPGPFRGTTRRASIRMK
jgi:hypothetical protein